MLYIDDGYKLFNCEVLIDILCLDCGLLNVSELIFTSSYEGVYSHRIGGNLKLLRESTDADQKRLK